MIGEKVPIPFQIKMKTCEFVTNLGPYLDQGHRLPCVRTSEYVIEGGNEVCTPLPCQGHRTPEPQITEHWGQGWHHLGQKISLHFFPVSAQDG